MSLKPLKKHRHRLSKSQDVSFLDQEEEVTTLSQKKLKHKKIIKKSRKKIHKAPKEEEASASLDEDEMPKATSPPDPSNVPLNLNFDPDNPENEEIPKRQRRRPFNQLEDTFILESFDGPRTKWNQIAEELGTGRTGKLVRERYYNFLDPNYDHSPWARSDLAYLCCLVKKIGTDWKTINNFFPRRTPANIKNAFTSITKSINYKRDGVVEKGEKHRERVKSVNQISQEMLETIREAVDGKMSEHPEMDFKSILFN